MNEKYWMGGVRMGFSWAFIGFYWDFHGILLGFNGILPDFIGLFMGFYWDLWDCVGFHCHGGTPSFLLDG